ncbi:hypothetical protein CAPTEDRAFT_47392, partial [Capitella teleta]
TIKGVYYAKLIEKIHAATKEKRRGLFAWGQFLQPDNSPSHNNHIAVASGWKCGFEILSHPPHSPDLTKCDYKQCGNLKK